FFCRDYLLLMPPAPSTDRFDATGSDLPRCPPARCPRTTYGGHSWAPEHLSDPAGSWRSPPRGPPSAGREAGTARAPPRKQSIALRIPLLICGHLVGTFGHRPDRRLARVGLSRPDDLVGIFEGFQGPLDGRPREPGALHDGRDRRVPM